jgi:hypothetical protein
MKKSMGRAIRGVALLSQGNPVVYTGNGHGCRKSKRVLVMVKVQWWWRAVEGILVKIGVISAMLKRMWRTYWALVTKPKQEEEGEDLISEW